jgi:hypothetical protein
MKNRISLLILAMVLLLSCAVTVFEIKAQGNTIIVPDNCATIEEAINSAKDGDTVLIKEGNYQGPINQTLIINQTINLVGENKENTKLHLNPPLVPMSLFTYEYMGYPDALRVEANGTTISGLTIDSPGGNIAINAFNNKIAHNTIGIGITVSSGRARIVDNGISGSITCNCGDNAILDNSIDGGIQSISSDYNLIAGNTVSGTIGTSGRYGISIRGNNTVIFNNTVSGSDYGVAVFMDVLSWDNVIAKNNLLRGGVYISSSTYSNTICTNNLNGYTLGLMGFNHVVYANQLSQVGIGGTHGGTRDAANNTFYYNNFVHTSPEFQVYTKQPDPLTLDNGYEGNFWSSYTGSGVAPYEVFAEYHYFDGAVREDANVSLGQDAHPLIAPFDVESVTIELPAWVELMLQDLPTPSTSLTSPSASETVTPTTIANSPTEVLSVEQNLAQQDCPSIIVIAVALAVVIIVSLLLLVKRRNGNIQKSTSMSI